MDRTKKFEAAKKYAKELGFERVWYYGSDSFTAENGKTAISVSAGTRYSGEYYVEIGWASAGIPRPTTAGVKKFIKMLQNALKLKEKLK